MATQIELIKKYGLSIRGHSGQHLLADPNMQRKVVNLLDPQTDEKILEIGPGLGALTGEILRRGARLWAVEKDKRFVSILRKEFEDFIQSKKFTIFGEDFLKFDFHKVRDFKKTKLRVIGNLPYYITAPILFHLMDHRSLISEAVLTIQKEVADRLTASPGSKNYGRLTLALRYAAQAARPFDIPPACFTPKPEVVSSVLSLRFHTAASPLNAKEEKWLFHTIQTAFSQRRKMLLHLMIRNSKLKMTREEAAGILSSLNIPLKVRGEELLLKDFIALAKALKPFFERKG